MILGGNKETGGDDCRVTKTFEEGETMVDIRCECGKIVCQSDQEFIVVKCRHCKRFMFVKMEDDSDSVTSFSHFVNRSQNQVREYSKHM